MATDIVLSVIAKDRPGLVETLAEIITAHEGNWVDSSMARLGGEFAGIVRITLPDGATSAFETAIAVLEDQAIDVTVRQTNAPSPVAGRQAHLELTGSDQPGIVHQIASAMAKLGVSIDDLRTEVFSGSMSGEKLFSAKSRILVPENVTLDDLSSALEGLTSDMMVDLDFDD